MRRVIVERQAKHPLPLVWEIIADIAVYPKYVKFIKKVDLFGPVAKDTQWDDITTILWLPMKVRHKITAYKKYELIEFDVFLPLGSKMHQTILLNKKDDSISVVAKIIFELNGFIDIFLGSLLEKRIKNMLTSTFDNIDAHLSSRIS